MVFQLLMALIQLVNVINLVDLSKSLLPEAQVNMKLNESWRRLLHGLLERKTYIHTYKREKDRHTHKRENKTNSHTHTQKRKTETDRFSTVCIAKRYGRSYLPKIPRGGTEPKSCSCEVNFLNTVMLVSICQE